MIGKTYLERGKPVTVLVRWGKGGGPRNVLIQREDGTKVVRPFRGLRKIKDPGAAAVTENHQRKNNLAGRIPHSESND